MEIIKLSQLQNDFNKAIGISSNRNIIIEDEITEVKIYVDSIPVLSTWRRSSSPSHLHKGNKIFNLDIPVYSRDLFNKAFYGIQSYGDYKKEKQLNETEETHEHHLKVIKQAFDFFEYYKWLKELLNTPIKTADTENAMPVKQRLLALHYLGMDTSEHNHTKCAEILAEVLGVGSENIRKSLSHLYAGKNNSVRTKNNLEKVKLLFDSQGLTQISNQIKADIEKL